MTTYRIMVISQNGSVVTIEENHTNHDYNDIDHRLKPAIAMIDAAFEADKFEYIVNMALRVFGLPGVGSYFETEEQRQDNVDVRQYYVLKNWLDSQVA